MTHRIKFIGHWIGGGEKVISAFALVKVAFHTTDAFAQPLERISRNPTIYVYKASVDNW